MKTAARRLWGSILAPPLPSVDVISTGTASTGHATVTVSHTCGVRAKQLLVFVAQQGTANPSVTTVAYNGVALTKIKEGLFSSNEAYSAVWQLQNPPTGAAHNIVVIGDTSETQITVTGISINDVVTCSNPQTNGTVFNGTNITLSTPSTLGGLILAIAANMSNAIPGLTNPAGSTSISHLTTGTAGTCESFTVSQSGTGSNVATQWTKTNNGYQSSCSIAIP